MYIENLTLNNFKNFGFLELEFNNINCIVGHNGVGKTNILDALYYLSFCKSFLSGYDNDNIKYGEEFFSIKGTYRLNKDSKETFTLSFKKNEKKLLKKGNQNYKKISLHIGEIPLVIVSPNDQTLITGRSENRRRFIDIVLSQTNAVYMDNLIKYNKCLEQRNKLLKNMIATGVYDSFQLNIWNERLSVFAEYIKERRVEFFEHFQEIFSYYYNFISNGEEKVNLKLKTFEGSLLENLKENYEKEKILGYTLIGIHRDDIEFMLNSHSASKSASQGQQKTFLLALKLAQYDYLKKQKHTNPILMLDDIFDKFDFTRVEKILELVGTQNFEQVFITDTHLDRVETIIGQTQKEKTKIITL